MILRRLGLAVAGLCLGFLAAVVVTAKPGDPALYPPKGEVETIHLVSHGWHSGLVLPRSALTGEGAGAALRAVAETYGAYDRIEVGWGETRFYRQTPTIRDVDWVLAFEALFTPGGSEGVIQVVGLPDDVRSFFPNSRIVPLALSKPGLARLLARLDAAFRLEEGGPVEQGAGLYGPSLFYAGNGRFSWSNLCNHWTAGLLDAAGVPTAPVLDTYPDGLILDLEWRAGVRPMPALTR